MGEGITLGSVKILSILFLLAQPVLQPVWAFGASVLQKRVERLETLFPGQFGIYVKDLDSGEAFSARADEFWYVASGVKVPIALEVLRQIDQGRFSLATRVRLRASDYLDGAGETNFQRPGSLLSVKYLLEQMLIHSDNTASDLLIRLVGLARVNRLVKSLVPDGFSKLTTLSDVRRNVFSGFHESARRLTNADFIALKQTSGEEGKKLRLAGFLKLSTGDFKVQKLDAAYSAYYAKKLNSATLRSYAQLLELIAEGKVLSAASTRYLLQVMERAQTGQRRIRAHFPEAIRFAHKTGTQHQRVCDFGIITNPEGGRAVVAACTKNIRSLDRAEAVLSELGEAIIADFCTSQ